MTSPLVSVIVAAHNAERTLPATMRSLEAQTQNRWEAIIVDDGSTDATATVAADLARRDPRTRVIAQRRMGPSSARNRGLREAQGAWVLFLDADDTLLPRHLERMLDEAVHGAADWVCCGWARLDPDGRVYDENWPPTEELRQLTARTCPWAIHACLTKRSLIDRVGGFDDGLATCEDWDLWQRIAALRSRLATVDELLAIYRTSDGSRSSALGRLLADGLEVVRRGHERLETGGGSVPALGPAAIADQPDVVAASWNLAAWIAARAAATSDDLGFVAAARLPSGLAPSLHPDGTAAGMLDGLIEARGSVPAARETWQHHGSELRSFLDRAAAATQCPHLTRQVASRIERGLATESSMTEPIDAERSTSLVGPSAGQSPLEQSVRAAYRRGRRVVVRAGRRLGPGLFPPRPHRDGAVPVLMYHQVAPDGPLATRRWRVTPDEFATQLEALRLLGCHTIDLATWRAAAADGRRLAGRPVVLTFDDGYRDFAEHAWPVLKRFGFGATMFVVTDHVGGKSEWDLHLGTAQPLLDWDELCTLAAEGVDIGSHSCSHQPFTGLAPADVDRELRESRRAIEDRIGRRVTSLAYPYGDCDPAVATQAGEAGYTTAVTCEWGACFDRSPRLSLPRIEVAGGTTATQLTDLLPFDRTR
jgi:peptidoglycan/xylan/chitin deacetylase (PgdA/CDA1 family)